MLWSYVKQNLIDLGFEEANYLSDSAALSIFCTATNKSRRIISQIKPLILRLDFSVKSLGETTDTITDGDTTNPITIDGVSVSAQIGNSVLCDKKEYTWNGAEWTSAEYVTYDLVSLTMDSSNITFDRVDKVQRFYSDELGEFSDYTIEQGYKLVMRRSHNGDFTVFYVRRLDNITPDTADDFDIQMDYEVEHLVPLLAGHYAWLDDDIQKATMYYNEFEAERTLVMQRLAERENNTAKMRIVGGIKWH